MFLGMQLYETEYSAQKIPKIQRGIDDVTERHEERNKALMKQIDLHVAPMKSLVRIQLGACLHTINYLQSTARWQI